MSERLVPVAWIENDVDPEVGFIGVIAHDREIEGSYAVVRRSCAESLLAEREATIAQQAEQLSALAKQCEKMRKALKTVVDDAEECTDHDGWTAMLLSLDAYYIASACLDEINALPDLASGTLPDGAEKASE